MSQSGVCIWYLIVNEHIFGPTYPPPPKKTKKKKKKIARMRVRSWVLCVKTLWLTQLIQWVSDLMTNGEIDDYKPNFAAGRSAKV